MSLKDRKTTERIAGLREQCLEAEKSYSLELSVLAKESYAQTEGEPMIVRRAKAYRNMLEKMTIGVTPGELLAGRRLKKPGAKPCVDFEKEQKRVSNLWDGLGDAIEYQWLAEAFEERTTDACKRALAEGLIVEPTGFNSGFGHIAPGYERVIKYGIRKLLEEIDESMKNKSGENCDFLRAAKISCEAVLTLSNRYSTHLYCLAEQAEDDKQRKEMERLSKILRKVPESPAESFYEALQSLWFIHMSVNIEQICNSLSIARPDQYLWPYLKSDLENNILQKEEAEELVDAFIVKLMENAVSPRDAMAFQQITIGGQTKEGQDAVNPLSFLFLESIAKIRCAQPLLAVRWHPGMDKAFLKECCECLCLGTGLPALYSDSEYLKALERLKVPREEALDYTIVGCVETNIAGKSLGATLAGPFNVAKCFELAINNGRSLSSGMQLGPETGYLYEFQTMEELWEVFRKQIEYAFSLTRQGVELTYLLQKEYYGYPLTSVLMDDAIEKGRDLNEGVPIDMETLNLIGTTNVTDAFAILEKQVFQEKRYTVKTLYHALLYNFEGFEEIHKSILEETQRFGSGSSRVVEIYRRVCESCSSVFQQFTTPRGGIYAGGTWPVMFPTSLGKHTAAGIDGRKAGTPLADSVGPVQGLSRNIPTTVAADVSSLDSAKHWPGGLVFNFWIQTSLFKTEEELDKLCAYIDTYFRMGGMQIQLNTIDKDILLDAQKHPEKHKDLMVRVGGFSAYFASLSIEEQNEIISRASYQL